MKSNHVSSQFSLVRLLVAASGTGGHVFPAIAVAEQLPDYEIEWLGVPDRMETQLVPDLYPLHTVAVTGFQQRFGLGTLRILLQQIGAIWQVRQLLKKGKFNGVLTTGGYIAAPAILAARSLGLPVVLHESNAIPGKVTRWFSPWCSVTAIGFAEAARYLPRVTTMHVGTPVRHAFRAPDKAPPLDLLIPDGGPLIVVVGGSQGAVAVNQLVRQAAPAWLEAGAWVVHLTGENDPDAKNLVHPHYRALPFYDNMAALLNRATFAISRAGSGSLTELAATHTPAILIPYPYAAEDHQTYNARVFEAAGAAIVFQQAELTPERLTEEGLRLLRSQLPAIPQTDTEVSSQRSNALQAMAAQAATLAMTDSAERMATLMRQLLQAGVSV
jgi:UDP-N-acetylglucosamine--N-acetylmuramyl-(pentapeptide) pyrophosphoryl-undecaprenol N-acetylglucosamine transferase